MKYKYCMNFKVAVIKSVVFEAVINFSPVGAEPKQSLLQFLGSVCVKSFEIY